MKYPALLSSLSLYTQIQSLAIWKARNCKNSRKGEFPHTIYFFHLIAAKKVVVSTTGLDSYFRSAQKCESFLRIFVRKYTDKPDTQTDLPDIQGNRQG